MERQAQKIKELIGKTPVHPLLFYSGKIAGYFTWAAGVYHAGFRKSRWTFLPDIPALVLFTAGAVLTFVSLVNLGRSVRLGLPGRDTKLETSGLYALSRNPMYVGFNLCTLSSMLMMHSWRIFVFGIYSIFTYYRIITAEEKFLERRFGDEYRSYRRKVRRYV
ncbi:MAG: methyltransferase family protein [Chitinispirillaceae bacterium]